MPQPGRALRCFALLLFVAAFGAAAEDFALQIQRPVAVGHRDHVTGTLHSSVSRSVTAAGKESQDTKDELYRFDVTSQVLRLSPKGNVVEAMLTIHQLTREVKGASTSLLAGEIVVGRFEKGEKVFEVQGKKIPKDVSEALSAAAPLHADDVPGDDDLLGTAKRRSLGESWPIDAEQLTRLLSTGDKFTFTPKDVTGTVKLVGRKPLADVPCFELQAEIEIHNPSSPAKPPEGLTATIPSVKIISSILLPVDPAVIGGSSSYRLEISALLSGSTQGVPVTGQIQMRRETAIQIIPLSAAEKSPAPPVAGPPPGSGPTSPR